MNSKDKQTQFSKGPLTKEELLKVKEVLDGLEKDPQAYDFLEPVDFVGLGLDDYPTIVKTPMDVATIRNKIKNNKYTSLNEIFGDVQLIWDNCKRYNMEGSDIYKMAIHCEKIIKKLLDKHFKPTVTPVSRSTKKEKAPTQDNKQESINQEEEENEMEIEAGDTLNLQEKINITERIRRLSNEGLAALVRLIQKECAQALEDIDNEKLQIRVDSIDRKTYDLINQLIETLTKVREASSESMGKKIKV